MAWRLVMASCAMAAALVPCAAHAERFGNDEVIALSRAGLGEGVLLAKIAAQPCGYDVGTQALLELGRAGVAGPVIAAMVDRCSGAAQAQGGAGESDDPQRKRTPGLYLDLGDETHHRLRIVRPTVGMSGQVSGNGSVLFPYTAKLGIPQAAAGLSATSATPVFYFYFETDDRRVGEFGSAGTASAQSPSEFTLVRFKVKGGQRELVVGKANMFHSRAGVGQKDAVAFTTEELGDGIFRVSPGTPLGPGQYAFLLRIGSDSYRIYDFAVG